MFESKTAKIVSLIIALVLLLVVVLYVLRGNVGESNLVLNESGEMVEPTTLEPSGETINATYVCGEGKSFRTSYDLGSNAVTLMLEGDMTYELPQAVSASGARYVSADKEVVFWEENGEAMVEMNGEMIHQGCTVQDEAETPVTSTSSQPVTAPLPM